MDALSDLLRVVRLDGAFFFAVEAAAPWSVSSAAIADRSTRSSRRCRASCICAGLQDELAPGAWRGTKRVDD